MYGIDDEVRLWRAAGAESPWRRDLRAAEFSHAARCRLVRFAVRFEGFSDRNFCDDLWPVISDHPASETGAMMRYAMLEWFANYGRERPGPQPLTSRIYRMYLRDLNRLHPDWRTEGGEPPDTRIAPTLTWLGEKLAAEHHRLDGGPLRDFAAGVAAVAYTITGADVGVPDCVRGEDFAGDRPESAAAWRCLPALLGRLDDFDVGFHLAAATVAGFSSSNVFIHDAVTDFLLHAYQTDTDWTEALIVRLHHDVFDQHPDGALEKRRLSAAGDQLPHHLCGGWKSLFQ